jgi:hypothetical protein
MSRRFNPRIDRRLVEARRKLRAAKSEYRRLLRLVQSECKHPVVYEAPWTDHGWVSPSYARRICCSCGREEESSWASGWVDRWRCTEADYNTQPGSKLQLHTDLVIKVTQSEINMKRLTSV